MYKAIEVHSKFSQIDVSSLLAPGLLDTWFCLFEANWSIDVWHNRLEMIHLSACLFEMWRWICNLTSLLDFLEVEDIDFLEVEYIDFL